MKSDPEFVYLPLSKVEMNACKKTESVKQRLKELSPFSYVRNEKQELKPRYWRAGQETTAQEP